VAKRILAVALAGFLLFNALYLYSAFSHPDYVFFNSYLSDLGAIGSITAPYFNSALFIAAFAVASVFFLLFRKEEAKFARASCIAGMLSAIALAGVGGLPTGNSLHFPVSVLFFLLAAASIHAYSSTHRGRGELALLAMGLFHTAVSLAFAYSEITGAMAPFFETVAVFSFQAWVIAASFFAEE
jgi:hypothetical membrane protein